MLSAILHNFISEQRLRSKTKYAAPYKPAIMNEVWTKLAFEDETRFGDLAQQRGKREMEFLEMGREAGKHTTGLQESVNVLQNVRTRLFFR